MNFTNVWENVLAGLILLIIGGLSSTILSWAKKNKKSLIQLLISICIIINVTYPFLKFLTILKSEKFNKEWVEELVIWGMIICIEISLLLFLFLRDKISSINFEQNSKKQSDKLEEMRQQLIKIRDDIESSSK